MTFRHTIIAMASFLMMSVTSIGQENERFRIRITYGFGTSESQLLGIDNYFYSYDTFKVALSYSLSNKKSWQLEGLLEPAFFNVLFMDYEEEQSEKELMHMKEYALSLGLIYRFRISMAFSTFLFCSTGPMITNTYTSRLNDGLSFANTFGLGLAVSFKSITVDLKSGIRHVSNASLKSPNKGYNSSITEVGLTILLQNKKPKIRTDYTDYYTFIF